MTRTRGCSWVVPWMRSSASRHQADKPGAAHKLFIRTDAAVMGVRGTEFTVDHDAASGRTDVHMLEGAVEVARSDEELRGGRGRLVSLGERIRADRSGLGRPERFDRDGFLKARSERFRIGARLAGRPPRSAEEIRSRRRDSDARRTRATERPALRDTERNDRERRRAPEGGPRRSRD